MLRFDGCYKICVTYPILPLTPVPMMCFVCTQEKAVASHLVFDQLKISSKDLSESRSRCEKKKSETQKSLEGENVKRRLIWLVNNAAQLSPSPMHLNQQPYRADDTVPTTVTSLLKTAVCVCVCVCVWVWEK